MDTQTETTNHDEYNGWINRETWAAALHLSNDEGLYTTARDIVMGDRDCLPLAANILERWITEEVELLHFPHPGEPPVAEWVRLMASVVGSFNRVDWDAVARSFIED